MSSWCFTAMWCLPWRTRHHALVWTAGECTAVKCRTRWYHRYSFQSNLLRGCKALAWDICTPLPGIEWEKWHFKRVYIIRAPITVFFLFSVLCSSVFEPHLNIRKFSYVCFLPKILTRAIYTSYLNYHLNLMKT